VFEQYQHEIASVLAGIESVENISDDIIIHAPDKEAHEKRMHAVLKRLINKCLNKFVSLINKCLNTGSVPVNLKVATVTPLPKKPSLDPSILQNYRPIFVLPFISKLLDKIMFNQLQHFLLNNCIYQTFQSGFRAAHRVCPSESVKRHVYLH